MAVLTATGLVNGRWQFSTPHRIHTASPITKKFSTDDYVAANFGANPPMEGFWPNGWNITIFTYTYIAETHLQGRSVDGFSHLMAQTTQTRARVCLLGATLILSHFGGEILQKPNFWGVNRRFQAKGVKYWKFHIIETTASISTKFCKTIETIRSRRGWSQSAPSKSKMADGRHFEKKPLNRHISATGWPILIRFGTVAHIGLLQRIYR